MTHFFPYFQDTVRSCTKLASSRVVSQAQVTSQPAVHSDTQPNVTKTEHQHTPWNYNWDR